MINLAEKKFNSVQVYKKLLDVITENVLTPNYRLQEQKLAITFNVSRTVIREALFRLSNEKIIRLEKNKGARVYCPDIKESKEVFHARKLLECSSLEESIKKINNADIDKLISICSNEKASLKRVNNRESIRYSVEFHSLLVYIAGNDVIYNLVKELAARTSLIISAYGTPYGTGCSCGNHEELIEIIKDRDVASAKKWLAKHFDQIQSSLHLDRKFEHNDDFSKIFEINT
jgi:DNA-binding GntR family transcriptional regulator